MCAGERDRKVEIRTASLEIDGAHVDKREACAADVGFFQRKLIDDGVVKACAVQPASLEAAIVQIRAGEVHRADIALFGHTHYSEYSVVLKPGRTDISEKGAALHIMNPGSVTRPRGGQIKGKSYGIILLDGKGGIKISLNAV